MPLLCYIYDPHKKVNLLCNSPRSCCCCSSLSFFVVATFLVSLLKPIVYWSDSFCLCSARLLHFTSFKSTSYCCEKKNSRRRKKAKCVCLCFFVVLLSFCLVHSFSSVPQWNVEPQKCFKEPESEIKMKLTTQAGEQINVLHTKRPSNNS